LKGEFVAIGVADATPIEGNVEPPRLAGVFRLKILAEEVCDSVTGLLRVVNGVGEDFHDLSPA
jgi:hypothetical protein